MDSNARMAQSTGICYANTWIMMSKSFDMYFVHDNIHDPSYEKSSLA